jgi:hypothetical protein
MQTDVALLKRFAWNTPSDASPQGRHSLWPKRMHHIPLSIEYVSVNWGSHYFQYCNCQRAEVLCYSSVKLVMSKDRLRATTAWCHFWGNEWKMRERPEGRREREGTNAGKTQGMWGRKRDREVKENILGNTRIAWQFRGFRSFLSYLQIPNNYGQNMLAINAFFILLYVSCLKYLIPIIV